jgi:hypothetical protein
VIPKAQRVKNFGRLGKANHLVQPQRHTGAPLSTVETPIYP